MLFKGSSKSSLHYVMVLWTFQRFSVRTNLFYRTRSFKEAKVCGIPQRAFCGTRVRRPTRGHLRGCVWVERSFITLLSWQLAFLAELVFFGFFFFKCSNDKQINHRPKTQKVQTATWVRKPCSRLETNWSWDCVALTLKPWKKKKKGSETGKIKGISDRSNSGEIRHAWSRVPPNLKWMGNIRAALAFPASWQCGHNRTYSLFLIQAKEISSSLSLSSLALASPQLQLAGLSQWRRAIHNNL